MAEGKVEFELVAPEKLLLSEPDVLLLDEPTNHLDLPAIEWFESVLASFRGALLVFRLLDFSINIVTLTGLVVVLGMVVDDAVVGSERIEGDLLVVGLQHPVRPILRPEVDQQQQRRRRKKNIPRRPS